VQLFWQWQKSAGRELAAKGKKVSGPEKQAITSLEIEADGKKAKVNLAEHAIAEGWGLDQLKATLLDHIRAERPSMPTVPGGLGYSTSTPAVTEAVFEAAMLQASRHRTMLRNVDLGPFF
jgi:hypothetical protein